MSDQNTGSPGLYRRWVHTFFITAILAAGSMFIMKLFAFMKTIKKDELAGFAFDPIMIYAFVALGFLFLLTWAYLSGQFRNLEGPKYDMLERFEQQVRAERQAEMTASKAAEAHRGA